MTKKVPSGNKSGEAIKAELVVVDEKLVGEAVVWIRDTALANIKKTFGEVGEYVIRKFFQDDVELAKSKNPSKTASFRALVDRCGTTDFPVSKTWLNNAVGVAMMNRLLPARAAFRLLPPSAQETLLPLRDPARVEKVADKAIEGEFTILQVRRAVRQERTRMPKDPRGRHPTPVITRTLNRSVKAFAFEGGKLSFTKADVEALDDDQKKDAVKSAKALIEKLEGLVSKLEKS
jgi:hypothetical protein